MGKTEWGRQRPTDRRGESEIARKKRARKKEKQGKQGELEHIKSNARQRDSRKDSHPSQCDSNSGCYELMIAA